MAFRCRRSDLPGERRGLCCPASPADERILSTDAVRSSPARLRSACGGFDKAYRLSPRDPLLFAFITVRAQALIIMAATRRHWNGRVRPRGCPTPISTFWEP